MLAEYLSEGSLKINRYMYDFTGSEIKKGDRQAPLKDNLG